MTKRRWDWRGLVVPVGLIGIAEAIAWMVSLDSDSIARPSDIAAAAAVSLIDGSALRGAAQTLACTFWGLGIGFPAGLALGILLGSFRVLDHLLEFTIETLRTVPSVALFPIALLVFGFGYKMEVSTVAFATLWPTAILARAAFADIEPRLLEVARTLQLGFVARVFKIIIPAAMPRLFVALRLMLGLSLILAITIEVTANTIGLGHTMMEAAQSLRPAAMLAGLVWIALIGWGLNALMLAIQAYLFGPMAIPRSRA